MTIDIKRLKTDAAYWDEVSPLGATHFWKPSKEWYQDCGDYALAWIPGREQWLRSNAPLRIVQPESIPRPTKPAAPEWNGEGYPPVGCECEVYDPKNGKWNGIKVTAHGEKVILSKWEKFNDEEFILNKTCRFRPIRTAEQRQRDEVGAIIRKAYLDGASGHIGGLAAITDAILSCYTLEPKP